MTNEYDLSNRTVAILATHGFEQSELMQPFQALERAGASPKVVSLPDSPETIRGWSQGDWSDTMSVDATIDEVVEDQFDALVLPGGLMNPDRLRRNEDAVSFVRDFFEAGKPVAAICHAPWLIIEAGAAKGRTMTSFASVRTDLENAGANWVDREVVVDQGLVTSRGPEDLQAFNDKILEEIEEGVHAGQHA